MCLLFTIIINHQDLTFREVNLRPESITYIYSKKIKFLAMSMSSLMHKIIICIGQNSRTPLSTRFPNRPSTTSFSQAFSTILVNNKIDKDWGIGKGSSCVTPLWLEKQGLVLLLILTQIVPFFTTCSIHMHHFEENPLSLTTPYNKFQLTLS